VKTLILEAPEKICVGETEDLSIQPDEVLLAIHGCAICGGDVKNYKGITGNPQYPRLISGHEFSGTVLEVGGEVKGIKVGDRLARCFLDHCGHCLNCRLGEPAFCLNARGYQGGGFGERVAAYMPDHGRGFYKIPEGISLTEATLCEPIDCAIGGLVKAEPRAGEWVAVIGMGGLGQIVGQMLSAVGTRIIGIDLQKEKLRTAAAFCYATIDASSKDVVSEVFRLTHGVGADLVMEVVGVPATFRQSMELVRMGGRIVIVGAHVTHLADGVNVDRIFRRDIQIRGAKGPMPLLSSDDEPLAFRYILDGIVHPSEIQTVFSYDQAQQAFEAQTHGGVRKAVILL